MLPEPRDTFPADEPLTQPDVAPRSDRPSAATEPALRATPKGRPRMESGYSIVPGRGTYESGVCPSETAPPPSASPSDPPDDPRAWRVSLMLGRIGRVTHYELLDVAEDADWHVVNRRYHALVNELSSIRGGTASPATRRKIDVLLSGLAEAYEALATFERRRAYDAGLREARSRGALAAARAAKPR